VTDAADRRAAELIRLMGLAPHREGGYFREFFRARATVDSMDERGKRVALTGIYFLLPAGAVSRWHRVRSDEVWQHSEGAPLELLELAGEAQVERIRLGPYQRAQVPAHCVNAGAWQAARSLGAYTLMTCTVAPGFEYADFELLADLPELAGRLSRLLPEVSEFL
jgi:predicted cupin superfamily sugar epimerase